VLADDRYLAEDAAALVAVDYEVLPAVSDCRAAIGSGAPAVRRELNSNIAASYKFAYGDVDAAFAKAAHIFLRSCGSIAAPPTRLRRAGGMVRRHQDHDGLGLDPCSSR
jgi:CO/xanthine dehydrogenase Mo-binding subunit